MSPTTPSPREIRQRAIGRSSLGPREIRFADGFDFVRPRSGAAAERMTRAAGSPRFAPTAIAGRLPDTGHHADIARADRSGQARDGVWYHRPPMPQTIAPAVENTEVGVARPSQAERRRKSPAASHHGRRGRAASRRRVDWKIMPRAAIALGAADRRTRRRCHQASPAQLAFSRQTHARMEQAAARCRSELAAAAIGDKLMRFRRHFQSRRASSASASLSGASASRRRPIADERRQVSTRSAAATPRQLARLVMRLEPARCQFVPPRELLHAGRRRGRAPSEARQRRRRRRDDATPPCRRGYASGRHGADSAIR